MTAAQRATEQRSVYDEDGIVLYQGDVLDVLGALPAESVDCVVTSPPYWSLRAYSGEQNRVWGGDPDCAHEWREQTVAGQTGGKSEKQMSNAGSFTAERYAGTARWQHDGKSRDSSPEAWEKVTLSSGLCRCGAWRGQYGLEPTPELYVAHTVMVLRAIRRVLKPTGVVWWNVGDSYAAHPGQRKASDAHGPKQATNAGANHVGSSYVEGLKAKDLVLIPQRVALAAQADGWYVRADVIWAKPNPMPESVTDRPTKAHEYVFLLTKSERYYWDQDAVREPATDAGRESGRNGRPEYADPRRLPPGARPQTLARQDFRDRGRNVRSVWTIPTQPSPLPHFAAFPEALAERCINAACPTEVCGVCGAPPRRRSALEMSDDEEMNNPKILRQRPARDAGPSRAPGCNHGGEAAPGIVLDCFAGTGTTLKVARDNGRQAIGIELSEEYVQLAVKRLSYGVRGVLAMERGQGALL